MKNCKYCNIEITKNRYCSDWCKEQKFAEIRHENYLKHKCPICNGQRERVVGLKEYTTYYSKCNNCRFKKRIKKNKERKEFISEHRCLWCNKIVICKNKNKVFCSYSCKNKYKYDKNKKPIILAEKECPVCKDLFKTNRTKKIYCNRDCASKAYFMRKK